MTNKLTKTNDLSRKISQDIFFGLNLKYLRKKNNFSAQDIADIIGFTRSQWANYENGVSYPKFEDLIKIANYFDKTENEIIHIDLSHQSLSDANYIKKSIGLVEEPIEPYGINWEKRHHELALELLAAQKQIIQLQQDLADSVKGNETATSGTSVTKNTAQTG